MVTRLGSSLGSPSPWPEEISQTRFSPAEKGVEPLTSWKGLLEGTHRGTRAAERPPPTPGATGAQSAEPSSVPKPPPALRSPEKSQAKK